MFNNRPALKTGALNPEVTTTKPQDNMTNAKFNELLFTLRDSVQKQLLTDTNGEVPFEDSGQLNRMIENYFNDALVEKNILLNRESRQKLLEGISAEIAGYGPLEPLLKDEEVTEIMVNGANDVYVEKFGKIEYTAVKFDGDAHLRRIIERIVAPLGRRVDEASPMVDARLPSGFRVNVTIPPLSLVGPILTIRKFAVKPFTAQDLIKIRSLSDNLVTFLKGLCGSQDQYRHLRRNWYREDDIIECHIIVHPRQ